MGCERVLPMAAQSLVNSFQCLRSVNHLDGWSEPHTPCYLKFLRFFGSLVIPAKSISMINQVNKEYPPLLVILLLSGYYGFFQFY